MHGSSSGADGYRPITTASHVEISGKSSFADMRAMAYPTPGSMFINAETQSGYFYTADQLMAASNVRNSEHAVHRGVRYIWSALHILCIV